MLSPAVAGLPVTIHLGTGVHTLDVGPFRFDATAQASEVWLIGSQGAELEASSGTAVLSVSSGSPRVSLHGLALRSSVAVDGGELNIDSCTFDGGSLVVSGGEVMATGTHFVGDAIDLNAGGSLVYRLPTPLGHWINSLGRDRLALTAGESYLGFPPSCSAGLYGGQFTTVAQSSPLCSGLCPAGFTCGVATVTPVVCERGGYCPAGSPAARPCPSGRHGNTAGLSSADQCIACPAGTSCGVGATDPMPCSPGTIAPNGSSATCTPCSEGTYQPNAGRTGCDVCGQGYYCPPGSSARIPASCNEGSFLPAGRAFADQSDCEPCPIGSWCVGGKSVPKFCGVGSFANVTGLGSCVSCRPGSFQNDVGATGCKLCPVASYCNGDGSSAATPCPGGTWSNTAGLEAEVQCTKVLKGQWAPTGSAAPKACPASGFYCPGYDGDKVNMPPGSEPILIDAGAARDTRNVSVVTFGLTLETDLSNYDPASTKIRLASLYDVPASSISLTVQAGSLQLVVTIRPSDGSDAGAESLRETIRTTTTEELTAELQVNATAATVETITVAEEYEATCPKGYWCSAGNTVPCPKNTYNEEIDMIDQGSCTTCPAYAFTDGESKTSLADCICEVDHYALWRGGELSCISCPVGANCSEPGSTFEHLPLDEGYWRAHSNTTDVRRCPGSILGSGCVGCGGDRCSAASFTGCRNGTGGPYCGLCASVDSGRVYYDKDSMECKACRESEGVPLLVLGSVVIALCLISLCRCWHKQRRAKVTQAAARKQSTHRPHIKEQQQWWARHWQSIKRRLAIKIKILFGFYQIATKVGDTYLVSFPRSVETTLEFVSFVNLELDGFGLPLACVSLGSFQTRLLFIMLAPVGVLACMMVAGCLHRDRSHEREVAERRGSALGPSVGVADNEKSRMGRMSSRVAGRASVAHAEQLSVAAKHSFYAFIPMALRVSFLAFPTVSSLAFKAFRCDDLDHGDESPGVAVMAADFAVVCWDADGDFTAEYSQIRLLAGLAILLYPVAVPCAYVGLFWKVRHPVWDEEPTMLSSSVRFLTGEYDKAFFFWELVEVLKKLVLVGAMSVVVPGEINQLVIGFIIVLCFLVALMVAKPYKRPEDDVIALTSGFSLVMFFFFSLILKYQTLTEAVQSSLTGQLAKNFAVDNKTNAALLLASTLGALVFGGAMIVVELSAAAHKAAAEQRKQAALQKELEELRQREKASADELAAMRNVLSEDKIPDVLKRCLIDMQQLSLDKKLGAGAFGEVWRGSLNGTPVAVKKLHRNKLDEANLKAFKAECELQLSLRHPNLVQIIGGSWTLEDVNVCLVLELCEKGTLDSLLEREPTRSTLSWAKHKLNIATGVARGMAYLHAQSPPIIHRDLKPENVLVDDGYGAKIADFGASREADLTKTMETAGTPLFMAPELLRKERYDESADVWSLACCLECMWTHEIVYDDDPDDESEGADGLLRRVAQGVLRPKVEGGFLKELVEQCSELEGEDRCSVSHVVEVLLRPETVAAVQLIPPGPPRGDGDGGAAGDALPPMAPADDGPPAPPHGLPTRISAAAMPAPPFWRSLSKRVRSQAAFEETSVGKQVSRRRQEKRTGGGVTFDDAAAGGGGGERTVRQGSSSSRLRGSKSGRSSEALQAACDRKRRSSHCYGFDADLTAPVKERPGRLVCRESSRNALVREEQRKSARELAGAEGQAPSANIDREVAELEAEATRLRAEIAQDIAAGPSPAVAIAAGPTVPTCAFLAGAVSRDEGGEVVEGGARESSWTTESNALAV